MPWILSDQVFNKVNFNRLIFNVSVFLCTTWRLKVAFFFLIIVTIFSNELMSGIIEEIQALEETAQQQLKDLEEKQTQKDQKRDEWYQKRRREEEARLAREKEARLQRQVQFEAAQKKLLQEQKVQMKEL